MEVEGRSSTAVRYYQTHTHTHTHTHTFRPSLARHRCRTFVRVRELWRQSLAPCAVGGAHCHGAAVSTRKREREREDACEPRMCVCVCVCVLCGSVCVCLVCVCLTHGVLRCPLLRCAVRWRRCVCACAVPAREESGSGGGAHGRCACEEERLGERGDEADLAREEGAARDQRSAQHSSRRSAAHRKAKGGVCVCVCVCVCAVCVCVRVCVSGDRGNWLDLLRAAISRRDAVCKREIWGEEKGRV